MAKQSTQIYQIKVTLDDTHPPIWRRILVPGNTTLLKLHDILQIVMGWWDYHLHMFTYAAEIYGNPADDEYGELGTLNEARYKLSQVIHGEGQRFSYEYDFGDSWEHTLLVEKIVPPKEGVHYPLCLKGKRACPPEDVGGVWGYEGFLEAIRDPNDEEYDEYLEWAGGEFDPEAFDLEEINARLHHMGRGRSAEASDAWAMDEERPQADVIGAPSSWLQTLTADQRAIAENLPLRRDVITLLNYLRDNKVTGTQSTGNLPLKAVREICAGFVNPPTLDEVFEERVSRLRSEREVWPLYFLHVLAWVGGLASGGLSRRWRLTPLGERFFDAPTPLQVWHLFNTWWNEVNWLVEFPFEFGDSYLPYEFPEVVLPRLLGLPVGEAAPFEPFADRVIEDAGLVWSTQEQETAHSILQGIIERIVINPLKDFAILETEYAPHKILGTEFQDLSTIRLTSFGKGLLEAMEEEMM